MKKFFISIIFCSLHFIFTTNLFPQQLPWKIKQYPVNGQVIKKAVDGMQRKGLYPVGMTYGDKGIYIMYLGNFVLADNWSLRSYNVNNINEMKKLITKKMREGFMPSGFATNGNTVLVLYLKNIRNRHVKSTWKPTAWKIAESETNLQKLNAKVQPLINKMYFPMALTPFRNTYLTFLVQIPGHSAKSWNIQGVKKNDVNKISSTINSFISKNKVPFGFFIHNGYIYFLFIGF